MPEIALHGTPDDCRWVQATMFFPSDESLRQFAFARMSAEASVHELDDNAQLSVDARTIRLLLGAPSFKEFEPSRTKAARAGLIAGDILVMIYLMAEVARVRKPSVNKAIHAYLAWSKTGATWGDGKRLPRSESVVRDAWSTHKGVAHFWGALRINEEYPFAQRDDVFAAGWNEFLGVAAGLLRFGGNFMPENVKAPAPILSTANCWSLPSSITPRRLVTDRLPDRLLELIKDYKAPQPM